MKRGYYVFSLIIGALGLWLVIDHIAGFTFPDYFYKANVGIESHFGINVVSAWADLSYFTYQTVIAFSLWCVGLFIGRVAHLDRLNAFLTHRATVTVIATNYTITCLLSLVFEFADGRADFGLYALNNMAWHNFGTNVLAHYGFYACCVVICLKLPTHGSVRLKHALIMLAYLIVYYVAVKITGMNCYVIEWYPYPLFTAGHLCSAIGITSPSPALAALLFALAIMLVVLLYYAIFFGSARLLNRRALRQETE